MKSKTINLKPNEIPRQWYNIAADIKLNPPLGPDGKPIGPEALAPVFPMNLIEQEVSTKRWIDIPEELLNVLAIWRPTPMIRAYSLEKALDTPARIYIKNESVSPPGSHKPNTAVAQAYFNKEFGIKRLTTETGAGQWGSALAFAGSQFGLDVDVFMVRISYEQKPFRKTMMEAWGGTCIPSPSDTTQAGRNVLKKYPDTPGSLGIAISEAVEAAVLDKTGKTRYTLGSVLNHVMLHQTIIGLESKKQLEKVNEYPDVIIGCAGGGSNFAGISYPYIYDKINGKEIDIYPVEPEACPTMTRAPYVYDHGDEASYTPLLAMHSLGHGFIPPPIHAGGLRYHGIAPTLSQLINDELISPVAVTQLDAFKAGILFSRTEGIIPAPETNHALACMINEAEKARKEGKEKTILVNLSGHGNMDLLSYQKYFANELKDLKLDDEYLEESKKAFESFPKPEILKTV